jgi:hypothetical protein
MWVLAASCISALRLQVYQTPADERLGFFQKINERLEK